MPATQTTAAGNTRPGARPATVTPSASRAGSPEASRARSRRTSRTSANGTGDSPCPDSRPKSRTSARTASTSPAGSLAKRRPPVSLALPVPPPLPAVPKIPAPPRAGPGPSAREAVGHAPEHPRPLHRSALPGEPGAQPDCLGAVRDEASEPLGVHLSGTESVRPGRTGHEPADEGRPRPASRTRAGGDAAPAATYGRPFPAAPPPPGGPGPRPNGCRLPGPVRAGREGHPRRSRTGPGPPARRAARGPLPPLGARPGRSSRSRNARRVRDSPPRACATWQGMRPAAPNTASTAGPYTARFGVSTRTSAGSRSGWASEEGEKLVVQNLGLAQGGVADVDPERIVGRWGSPPSSFQSPGRRIPRRGLARRHRSHRAGWSSILRQDSARRDG